LSFTGYILPVNVDAMFLRITLPTFTLSRDAPTTAMLLG
jgi:hypothetical protein